MELQNTEDKQEVKKATSNELKKRVQEYRKIYEILEQPVSQIGYLPLIIEQEINPNSYSYLI